MSWFYLDCSVKYKIWIANYNSYCVYIYVCICIYVCMYVYTCLRITSKFQMISEQFMNIIFFPSIVNKKYILMKRIIKYGMHIKVTLDYSWWWSLYVSSIKDPNLFHWKWNTHAWGQISVTHWNPNTRMVFYTSEV